jgi:hypothetical protein
MQRVTGNLIHKGIELIIEFSYSYRQCVTKIVNFLPADRRDGHAEFKA